eukprot:CAMPEP_0117695978 /NCGR_PEP_ID=MMETSP0804-20121206/28434_1 /TAXON_ID=1074897 /ORGANISM="Tetraselmis astigmatica, Strain CCMP880" /LENGTH=218 /DNA_ID=CAMNT_0005510099 /DNA_START=185 /DNA_END=837 /DNA_ORIENTATION=-
MSQEDAAVGYSRHWNGVYVNRPDQLTREWHCDLDAVRDAIQPYVQQALTGAKPSDAEEPRGASPCDSMRARYAADPTVQCCVADCRVLPVGDYACELLLDKGTLDALHGDVDKMKMMQECKRVLSPGGVMLSISFGAVARLGFLKTACTHLGLQHRNYIIGEGDPLSGHQVWLLTAIAHKFVGIAGEYSPDALTSTVLARVERTGSMYDDETEEDAIA